jgi:type VI secretion system ImpA family protein
MSPKPSFQFDVEAILRPISAESPVGESLQFSDVLDKIREAQREDDATLNRGVWTFGLKRADWVEVERLCLEVLKTKAKDLQVAAALIDAWVHRYGFAGLREGLQMLRGLVGGFADHLLPKDADDLEYRLSPIDWLNDKLSLRIKLIPITSPSGDDVQPCSFADFERARDGERRPKDKGGVPPFQQSALLTSTESFLALLHELDGCMAAYAQLEFELDEKLGHEAPSLRRLWSVLESTRNLIAGFLDQRDVPVEQWTPEPGPSAPAISAPPALDASVPVFSSRPIRSRDEAYQVLAEAADYLARTEPHSPAPYLIKRAITWGTMSLDMLLPELVRNDSERNEIFRLLQIQPPPK